MNKKTSSQKMATKAARILGNDSAPKIQRTLAASVVSQVAKHKTTGASLEGIASKVMKSPKYNKTTKSLAASILSQSDRSK